MYGTSELPMGGGCGEQSSYNDRTQKFIVEFAHSPTDH